MAAAKRKPHPALIERLLREPEAFEFFRAVHVLETLAAAAGPRAPRERIGHDLALDRVGLRFASAPSQVFPACPVSAIDSDARAGDEAAARRVLVSFLGVFGPAGNLPMHYTETVLQRLHEKDSALRDFLDVFHDRAVAFFYRAWKKYRLPVSFTSADRSTGRADPVLESLLCLVGHWHGRGGRAFTIDDLAEVHHAGLFSDRRRSADGLRVMLRGLLGCDVKVESFVGQWVELDEHARSRLGGPTGAGTPARLGEQTVLGGRVWSVDSRVRVVAGPLDRGRFRELWPGGEPVRFLRALLRNYLGPLLECDLLWQLADDAPAPTRLGGDQRLGRDCWLGWSEFGSPTTLVSSPVWHNLAPPGSPRRTAPTRSGSHDVSEDARPRATV